nr:hypothetical protein [Tanacetum cinerariifolium]
MSSASYAVTYTFVYTDSEPWRPVAPPSPDYIPGLEEPHDPDYVPEPIYPEYIPLEDDHVFLVEEQPLPPVDAPTAESPRYVAESDLEEDPEEYEDDETEDGLVDYPMDGEDDGDNDDGDSSGDDADDEDEEEEEHLAPTDFVVVIPIVELVSPLEGIEPVIPPPSTDTTTTGARITVDPTEAVPEISPMTLGEVNTRVTEHAELHVHDTKDLYALLEDAQDSRTRISQRVTMDSQRVDLLQGTDGKDSPSDRRHEMRDGRHADRVVSTARAAEES